MVSRNVKGFALLLPALLIGSLSTARGQEARSPVVAQRIQPLLKPEEITVENDIEYANPDDQHLKVNMARPAKGVGPFPAIVCIHGGGFRAGDRNGYNDMIRQLAQRGYVAVTVEYRLAPKYPFPAAVYDVKASVRWLRANAKKYNVNPVLIGAMGGSAGANLAEILGVTEGVKMLEGTEGNLNQSSAVQAVVSYFGPTDFTKSYGKSVDAAEVLPLYLGGDLVKERVRHLQASPLYWITPIAAPTLCIHGTKDTYVADEQAHWFVDKMKATGVEAELLTLENAGHGFGGGDARRADEAMFAFFKSHLVSRFVGDVGNVY
ncbi:MAG: alpha/beta hydrolase [Chthonomonadaceae bacterium]|nr:alpha/beta hydrolase [Chthonomonadaceae bacterium]